MANSFDFNAFSALKQVEYLKQHAKPAIIKKAKAGIIFTDYKLAGKKQACVFIPFKKVTDAMQAFKDIKAFKVHLLKKTALVGVEHGKTTDGTPMISVEIKKGGISTDILMEKGADFFLKKLQVQLDIEVNEDTNITSEDSSTELSRDISIPAELQKNLSTIKEKYEQVITSYTDDKLSMLNVRQQQSAIKNIEKLSQAIININQKATKFFEMDDLQGYNSFKKMMDSYSQKLDQLKEKLEESQEDVQWDNAEVDALEDSILKGRSVSDVVADWNIQSQQLTQEIEKEIKTLTQQLKQ